MNENSRKTKRLALNSILGALAVICLLLATILPTARISLYALSSFFVAITIMESGARAGWLFYAATSLLALILVPNKPGIVPYVLFFGLYGVVKFYIERLNRLVPEYVLKLLFLNASAGAAFLLVREFIGYTLEVRLPWWILIIALEIVFIVYDVVYTLFINYYKERLKPLLKL